MTGTTPSSSADVALPREHLVQLDGLRGMAILLVMLYHFCLPHTGFHGHDSGVLLQLAQGGWMGVDLFFVLSGFLITGILVQTREQTHYFRNFLGRRFLRIWPLYYLSLLVLLILIPLAVPAIPPELQSMRDKQWWFWLYASNWLFAREGGFAQTSGGYFWSLAVEEQFYLLWPLVVYLLTPRGLLRTSVALLVVSLIARVVLARAGVGTGSLYTMTFTHLDGLAVGSSIAICVRSPQGEARLRRLVPAVAIVAALGLLAVRYADGDLFFWSRNMAIYGYTLIATLFGALLVWVLAGGHQASIRRLAFSNGFMTRCGKYSYALYMVHVPVASLLYPRILGGLSGIISVIGYESVFLIAAAASFALSWALAVSSWYLFEKRILALKRFFTYSSEPGSAAEVRSVVHTLPS
jgi:peptidoglycan/LPS O-acetylase OafA/YrhL